MTDTLTKRNVVYVDHFSARDSSVIDEVYLIENDDVYVVFKTGRVAGYRGVGKWVFNAFANAGSVGQYYNAYIKEKFLGLNGNVVFVQKGAAVTRVEPVRNAAPQPVVENAYEVIFDLGGKEVVFPVNAENDEAALQAGLKHVEAFAGLKFVPARVVRYLV